MPGNIVKINGSNELSWYVGDSHMDNLIKYLDEIGFMESEEIKDEQPSFLLKFFHRIINRFSINFNFSKQPSICIFGYWFYFNFFI